MPSDPPPSPPAQTAGPAVPPPATTGPSAPAPGSAVPANRLTPAEQMALFEKELKENDWGHQPC